MISMMSNNNSNKNSNANETNDEETLTRNDLIEKKYKLLKLSKQANINSSISNTINNNCSSSNSINNYNQQVKPEQMTINNSDSGGPIGDKRTMDAADTLVSLANSANTTPTTEYKPFIKSSSPNSSNVSSNNNIEILLNTTGEDNNIIEKTICLTGDNLNSTLNDKNKSSNTIVESACKLLIEQVLKSCPNVNLSSITIKTTAVPSSSSSITTTNTSSTSIPASSTVSTVIDLSKNDKLDTALNAVQQIKTGAISNSNNNNKINNDLTTSINNNKRNHSLSSSNLNEEIEINYKNKIRKQIINKPSQSQEITKKMRISDLPSVLMNNSINSKYNNNSNKNPPVSTNGNSNSYIDDDGDDDDFSETTRDSMDSLGKPSAANSRRDSVGSTSNGATFNNSGLRPAPTLATGRRSKDTELPPDEARKRHERRERNKEAAARCRRKRENLAITLTKQTEELAQERENIRQTYNDLIKEKNRLESLLSSHEKSCSYTNSVNNHLKTSSSSSTSATTDIASLSSSTQNNSSQTTQIKNQPTPNSIKNLNDLFSQSNQQQQQQQQQNHHQQLLKMRKEELNEIIKQSNERKFLSNKYLASSPYQSQNQSLNQNLSNELPFTSLNSFSNNTIINNNKNDKNNFSLPLFSSTAGLTNANSATSSMLTPNSASTLETFLNHFETPKPYNSVPSPSSISSQSSISSSASSTSSNTSTNASATSSSLQRPNNLSLKTSSSLSNNSPNTNTTSALITPSPASLATSVLMQGLAMAFNSAVSGQPFHPNSNSFNIGSNNNISLLMTPTLQLNTPTLFALTPLEATLSAFNSCNTPMLPQHTPILSIPHSSLSSLPSSSSQSSISSTSNALTNESTETNNKDSENSRVSASATNSNNNNNSLISNNLTIKQ